MTAEQKERLKDRWVPVIFAVAAAVAANVFGGAMAYQKLVDGLAHEQNIRAAQDAAIYNEMMPMDKRLEMFVTRREYSIRQVALDETLKDIKGNVQDTNRKIDILLQRN